MRAKRVPIWMALVAIALVVGCAAGIQMTREQIQDPGQLLFNGFSDKKFDCYYCHNGDGKGAGRGSDLSKALPKMPDEAVRKVVMEGSGFMPAFKSTMEPAELDQILAWLRQAFGGPQVPKIEAVETEDVAE